MAAGTARVVPLEGAAVVRMTDNLRFDPATVTIQSGQTVQWINDARQAHTVIDDPAVAVNKADAQLPPGAPAFNSDKIEPGRSYVYTFTVPGTYRYFCGPHEGEGMVGEVIVQ
jgi:plastocyanin